MPVPEVGGDLGLGGDEPADLGTTAVLPPPPPPTHRRRRRRWIPILGLAVALAVGASVAILSLSGGQSRKASPAGSPSIGSLTPSPPAVLPPVGLSAKAKPFSVTLTWSTGTAGDAVGEYRLYRDGVQIDTVQGSAERYVNDTAFPGNSYLYELEARGVQGGISARAAVQVKTPVPPLSAARVEGDFRVSLKPGAQYGYSDLGRDETLEWRLKPRCKEGACDILLIDSRGARFILHRDGARYAGATSVKYIANCRGTQTTSSLMVSFRVVKADAINRVWVATVIRGTTTNREAPQLGCISSSRTYSLSGKVT